MWDSTSWIWAILHEIIYSFMYSWQSSMKQLSHKTPELLYILNDIHMDAAKGCIKWIRTAFFCIFLIRILFNYLRKALRKETCIKIKMIVSSFVRSTILMKNWNQRVHLSVLSDFPTLWLWAPSPVIPNEHVNLPKITCSFIYQKGP